MPPSPNLASIDDALPILSRTPRVLRVLLDELPAYWLTSNYGEGTWSPHQVLGHLIWGENTDWIPRARLILTHGESRPFEPFDRAGHDALCREKSTPELLDLFDAARAASLQSLREMALTPADLDRRGLHPAFGPVTLGQLLATWVVHDLNHTAQICKAMAHQNRPAVGPWEAYLSILSPPAPR